MTKKLGIGLGLVAIVLTTGYLLGEGESRHTEVDALNQSDANQGASTEESKKEASRTIASIDSKKTISEMLKIEKMSRDYRVDAISEWKSALKSCKAGAECKKMVKAGLVGFKSLDPESQQIYQLTFAGALMNLDDASAKKFIDDLAKRNASDSNLLLVLLQQADPSLAKSYYPNLVHAANLWSEKHKDFKYDPSIKNFTSDDAALNASIEGAKFVAQEVSAMNEQLTKIK